MAMYRFYQTGEEGVWHPIVDSDSVLEDAKRQGAKKLTILAVNKALSDEDARRGHSYKGPLYFDIDLPDVDEAISSARQLVRKLVEVYDTPTAAIQIYLSGKKGLHILVDQRAFMQRRTAVKDLPLIYKQMAVELYVSGVDLGPYACGKNNTFRIVNMKRYDGNFRVPVTITELEHLDSTAYKQMVSGPRLEVPLIDYAGEMSMALHTLYAQSIETAARNERELTERSRALQDGQLEKIAAHAPPCVEEIAAQRGLTTTANFNTQALNLALWAARAGVPDIERERVFAMTADNAEPSTRYPNSRARRIELEGKYRFAMNSPDYKFGCGAMRSLVKAGRKICAGCILETTCKSTSPAQFFSDFADSLGIFETESGYSKVAGKGRTEPLSTFILRPQAVYMEPATDGTGMRRRGTYCRVMRHGEQIGAVVLDEQSWASKSSFLKALEGLDGVYYIGGDAEVQRIKLLVFAEQEEGMPEIHQVKAVGIHLEKHSKLDLATYVEPGRSLNSLHMIDTHRLKDRPPMSPRLFEQTEVQMGDVEVDQALANLCSINRPSNMAVIIGWFLACHLKSHLHLISGQFPLISIWGASGSGKSKTVEIAALLSGVSLEIGSSAANCSALNKFNAIELLSSSTTVPRICEEYNRDKLGDNLYNLLGELFKAVWGGESASRGSIANGQAVSRQIPLTGPVVYVSEQQPKMPALMERSLVLHLVKAGRNSDAMERVNEHKAGLLRFGQLLMMTALRTPVATVEAMLKKESESVSKSWDHRPRYSLMVVHMALTWAADLCAQYRLNDAADALKNIKRELKLLTAEEHRMGDHEGDRRVIMGNRPASEVDVFLSHLFDLIVDSASVISDQILAKGMPTGRRPAINPRTDFCMDGNTLYIWGKQCHARVLDHLRSLNVRSPLQQWSDFEALVESEPYFHGWKPVADKFYGQPALALDMTKLTARRIDCSAVREIYATLGQVPLEF